MATDSTRVVIGGVGLWVSSSRVKVIQRNVERLISQILDVADVVVAF